MGRHRSLWDSGGLRKQCNSQEVGFIVTEWTRIINGSNFGAIRGKVQGRSLPLLNSTIFILNRTIQFLDMRRPAPSSTKWWLMMIVEFESRPRMVKNPNMTIARWISSGPIIEQLMVIVKSLLLLPFSHHFCPYSFLFALYFSSYSHFISWDKKKFLFALSYDSIFQPRSERCWNLIRPRGKSWRRRRNKV